MSEIPRGVRVTVAGSGESERRRRPTVLYLAILVVAVVLASGGVLLAVRSFQAKPQQPATQLDARSVPAVTGQSRLVLLGPSVLLDTRGSAPLPPGARSDLTLPGLPSGSTAALVEVSVVQATGPGEVMIGVAGAEVAVLQAAKAGVLTSATTVVPLGKDGPVRVSTAGGGHLVVNLIGAFEPVVRSTGGRIVAVPPVRVVRLVPQVDGRKDATIDAASVPGLAPGTAAAILLQVAADVGTNGGFVRLSGSANRPEQPVFWSATAGAERVNSM